MNLTGTFALSCTKCKKKHTFSSEEGDFRIAASELRNNALLTRHEMTFDFNCDRCGSDIQVEYIISECPPGILKSHFVRLTGGKVLSRYEYGLSVLTTG